MLVPIAALLVRHVARALFMLSAIALVCLGALPRPSVAAADAAPAAVIEKLDAMLEKDGVPGVTLVVFKDGAERYRVDAGALPADGRVPIASASKWIAAALIMTVVDEGKLSLDEPIGKRLPAFTGPSASITLRQLLSFTSGQGDVRGLVDVRQSPAISLQESARRIAAIPLTARPGTAFGYGSPALQVAGALAERATGESWQQLFDERLAGPLRMTHTTWGNMLWKQIAQADVHNPNLQSGIITTADDYGRFLTMLAAGGSFDGRRILSTGAIEQLETAQTGNAKPSWIPPGAKAGHLHYALGNWCEAVEANDACSVASSPGALGTYPWIDRTNGIYGIFLMQKRMPAVERDVRDLRAIVERTLLENTRREE